MANLAQAQVDQSAVDNFVRNVAYQQKRPMADVAAILAEAKFQPTVIDKMTRPAEKTMTWERYRNIFIKEERIGAGVAFWEENEKTLNQVSSETGVSIETIIGILGVETYFGQRMGTYRVLDALYTLAFGYPKRASFFKSELKKFLELSEKEGLDPLEIKGSYAGAIGYGQFMPSSYLAYAKSFDPATSADLVYEVEDGIASVANYIKVHRWEKGARVAVTANKSTTAETLPKQKVRPSNAASFYTSKGYEASEAIGESEIVSLQAMTMEDGSKEYWFTLENFYVITRYNHSPLYALAVFQLGEAVSRARKADKL